MILKRLFGIAKRVKLSIVVKLSALVAGAVIVTALAVNEVYVRGSNELLIDRSVDDLQQEAAAVEYPLQGVIQQLKADVRLLVEVQATRGLMRARLNDGRDPLDNSTAAQWESRLATIFEEMLHTRENYLQVRVVGAADAGAEVLRVERIGNRVEQAPERALQRRYEEAYFREALGVSPGQVYLSAPSLDREHGQIMSPHRLVLRAAGPIVGPGGETVGLVIIDMDFGRALRGLRANLAENRQLYIANASGDYLLHPDQSRLFATDLGHERRIQRDEPRLLSIMSDGEHNEAVYIPDDTRRGNVLAFRKFRFDELNPDNFIGIAIEAPYRDIVAGTVAVSRQGFLSSAGVALVALVIGVWLLRLLIRPLNAVADGVVRYRKGEKNISLPTDSPDEIGVLSREFSTLMAQKNDEDWVKENLVAVSRNLLGFKELASFADGLLETLAPAVGAQVGVVYVCASFVGRSAREGETLDFLSAYGFSGQQHEALPRSFRWGEGLVGSCARMRARTLVSDVPSDYLRVASALGEARPGQVLLLPILFENALVGVLELAAIGRFSELQIDFLEQACASAGVIMNSISAGQRAELARARLNAVIDNAIDGLITINTRGIVESFNPACERIFGYKADEVIGRNVKMLMPEPFHSEHDGYVSRHVATGEAKIIGTAGREVSAKRKDGSVFPMDLSISAFTLADGKRFSGILRDITDRKAMEAKQAQYMEELQRSEEELKTRQEELEASYEEMEEKTRALEEQNALIRQQSAELEETKRIIEDKAAELELSNRYKSEFLANMSHELRTPLNSLLILARGLAANEEGNLTAEQVEEARVIHGGGMELLSLINDILDLSKVEAGKINIVAEAIYIDDIVKRLAQQFEPIAGERGVPLHVRVDKALPQSICTDAQRVEQILKNLLSNAFKFTKTGSVTLDIRRTPDASALQHAAFRKSEAISFAVIDTGIGIEKSRLKDIFEAFQQEDGSIDRHYGGTGLGLTIARKFAHLLNGEIHVESEKGKGSTFTLHLPIESAVAAPSADKQAEPAASQTAPPGAELGLLEMPKAMPRQFVPDDRKAIGAGDKVVLVIEDDRDFAQTLVKVARRHGYKAVAAGDGKSGLLFAAERPPTAILLDLRLPDIDGLAVLDQLKHDLRTRHIPVHVISGRDEGDAAAPLRKGAIGFLTKPVSVEALDSVFGRIEGLLRAKVKKVLVVEDDRNTQAAIQALLKQKQLEIVTVDTGESALEMSRAVAFDCVILDLKLPDMTGFDWLEKFETESGETAAPPVIVYTAKELTEEENRRLNRHTGSIVIKGASSSERLLDEVTLFLHSMESALTGDQHAMIRMQHDPDRVLKGRRVLLVDDDLRNTFALSKLLRKRGMEVVIADNGQMALDKLKEEPSIELVVMDIMMPIMDGYEAIRRIRAQERWRGVPIIALTARAMPEEQQRCIEAGANDYLTKPVDVERLLALLRVWLFRQEKAA
jgi:PAS domain S-box-containing protein